jgi:hypothetical protein
MGKKVIKRIVCGIKGFDALIIIFSAIVSPNDFLHA